MKTESLIEFALLNGISEAVVIPAEKIVVDKMLSEKCRTPRCPFYGLSKSCPPASDSPEQFKRRLKEYKNIIFCRIDVPKDVLFSNESREIFKFLHETLAKIEIFSKEKGFKKAKAYAAGSCKELFCNDFAECGFLSENKCRFPHQARESMSGAGVNVNKLKEAVGWDINGLSAVYGLLLLD